MSAQERWHGTSGGYGNHKCRCDDCREAHRVACSDRKENRLAERVDVNGVMIHPRATHGTANGYRNYGCRCDPCVAAGSRDSVGRTIDRSEERVEVDGRLVHMNAPHGTATGYNYYWCRCRPCTDAHVARKGKRKMRESGRAAA